VLIGFGGLLGSGTITTGVVFDIRRFSIHDGPGIRTTVFLKGCPLRCWWCHNPEGLSAAPELVWRAERCTRCGTCIATCPEHALSWNGDAPHVDQARCTLCGECAEVCYAEARQVLGRTMTAAQVLAEVERDGVFYDVSAGGVTFSGGEPLAQPEFLRELLLGCRAREIHTAVDTCGHAPWATVDRVRAHVSLFLYDLKLLDDDRHRRYTGVSNAVELENLTALAAAGHDIELRFPLIPGINDDEDHVRRTGAFVARLARPPRVVVLPYHGLGAGKYGPLGRDYRMTAVATPAEERIAAVAGTLRGFGLQVEVLA
jgi:pyruvate formate lyase activating enzyme